MGSPDVLRTEGSFGRHTTTGEEELKLTGETDSFRSSRSRSVIGVCDFDDGSLLEEASPPGCTRGAISGWFWLMVAGGAPLLLLLLVGVSVGVRLEVEVASREGGGGWRNEGGRVGMGGRGGFSSGGRGGGGASAGKGGTLDAGGGSMGAAGKFSFLLSAAFGSGGLEGFPLL